MATIIKTQKKYDYRKVTTLKHVYAIHPGKVQISKIIKALEFVPGDLRRGMIATLNAQMMTYVINNNDPQLPVFDPNYNNDQQKKHGPWCIGGDASGSGFSVYGSGWSDTFTCAGGRARLALRDNPRFQHVKKYFPDLWKEFFLMLNTKK